MLSEFKRRLALLRLNLINTYHQDTAYFWNTWGEGLSTTMYTLTYLLFVNIMFSNVHSIAGYSRDQVLFFTLIGQLDFYLLFSYSYDNLELLSDDINRGNLDLILTKPLPALFYVCTRKLSSIQLLRDGGIPTTFVILSIHWQNLQITPAHLAAGVVTFICGLISFHVVQFFLLLPAFWSGKSSDLLELSYSLSDYDLPYEGFPRFVQIGFTVLIPTLISVGISTSVILGKSDPHVMIPLAISVATIFVFLRRWGWNLALRHYTSASS